MKMIQINKRPYILSRHGSELFSRPGSELCKSRAKINFIVIWNMDSSLDWGQLLKMGRFEIFNFKPN